MKNIALPTPDPDAVENYSEHLEHTFCYDGTCPCHESHELMRDLGYAVVDGLATTEDANRIYKGKNV